MRELEEGNDRDREEKIEEQRESVKQRAYQYMTQDAISRLGNVRAAKPELAHGVTAQIARLGEMNRIGEVDEESLKEILRELQKEKQDNSGNISFRR